MARLERRLRNLKRGLGIATAASCPYCAMVGVLDREARPDDEGREIDETIPLEAYDAIKAR
jgi:glutaredoxin